MKDLEIGQMVTAKFATMNKNETLDQYKEECSKEAYETIERTYGDIVDIDTFTVWDYEDCKIEQIFNVTPKEWGLLTNSFLDDHILWREKGGTIYTGTDKDFNEDLLGNNPAMLEDYRNNNARLVTIITNNQSGEAIAIDPQGYKYARYVGIDITKHD